MIVVYNWYTYIYIVLSFIGESGSKCMGLYVQASELWFGQNLIDAPCDLAGQNLWWVDSNPTKR